MRVFVISLKTSVERRDSVNKQLNGFDFSFFDAVDFSKKEHDFIFDFYDDSACKKWKGRSLTEGELGCFASHAMLWQECVRINESILVLEDNIHVENNFLNDINAIRNVLGEYGIVKLQSFFDIPFYPVQKLNPDFFIAKSVRNGCGSTAYMITPGVAEKYLASMEGFIEPLDDFIESEWITDQPLYYCYPPIAYRSGVSSVIGERRGINGKRKTILGKLFVEYYRAQKKLKRHLYNKRFKKLEILGGAD